MPRGSVRQAVRGGARGFPGSKSGRSTLTILRMRVDGSATSLGVGGGIACIAGTASGDCAALQARVQQVDPFPWSPAGPWPVSSGLVMHSGLPNMSTAGESEGAAQALASDWTTSTKAAQSAMPSLVLALRADMNMLPG
jgi:hypothetical protein